MTYHAVCRSHRFFFTSDQRNWQNARAFDEFRSHLVTVGRIDQMRSAFGQTRSAIGQINARAFGQLRAHLAKCADWSNAPYSFIGLSGILLRQLLKRIINVDCVTLVYATFYCEADETDIDRTLLLINIYLHT